MKKELIEKIRCMLDFIEKFDEFLGKAKRDGDFAPPRRRTCATANACRTFRRIGGGIEPPSDPAKKSGTCPGTAC